MNPGAALRWTSATLAALAAFGLLVIALRGEAGQLVMLDFALLLALLALTPATLWGLLIAEPSARGVGDPYAMLPEELAGDRAPSAIDDPWVRELREELARCVADFDAAMENARRLRGAAEQVESERSELLRAVSHELRTPLNTIVGFADVLMAEIDGPLTEEQRKDLHSIRSAGRHLSDLFNDVIDLTAAESSQLELRLESFPLRPLLVEVVDELRGQLMDEDVTLEVEARDEGTLRADPKRVRQILHNLGSNALRHTTRGTVRFVLATELDQVRVSVIDTGAGIAPDDQRLIFDTFGQAEGGARGLGAGVGLSISKRLAELHEGAIELESTVGQGSTFSLLLPVDGPDGELDIDAFEPVR